MGTSWTKTLHQSKLTLSGPSVREGKGLLTTKSANTYRQEEGGFIGAEAILAELPKKIGELPKRRVGLFVDGAPAREGTPIHSVDTQEQIGMLFINVPFLPILRCRHIRNP